MVTYSYGGTTGFHVTQPGIAAPIGQAPTAPAARDLPPGAPTTTTTTYGGGTSYGGGAIPAPAPTSQPVGLPPQTKEAAKVPAPTSKTLITQRGGGLSKAYGGVLTTHRVKVKDMATGKVTTLGKGHFLADDQKTITNVLRTGGYIAYYPKTDTYYIVEGSRKEAPPRLGAAATPKATTLPTPTVSLGTGQSIFTDFRQQQIAYSPYGRRPYLTAKEQMAEAERTKLSRMAGPPWKRSVPEQIAMGAGESLVFLALAPVMIPYSIYQTAKRPMETARGIKETATRAPAYFLTSILTGVVAGGAVTRAFGMPRTPVIKSQVIGKGAVTGRTTRGFFTDIEVSLPKIFRTTQYGKATIKQEISSFAKVSVPREKIPSLRAKLYGAPKDFTGDISALAEGFSVTKTTMITPKRPFFTPWRVKQIVTTKEAVTQYPRVFIGKAPRVRVPTAGKAPAIMEGFSTKWSWPVPKISLGKQIRMGKGPIKPYPKQIQTYDIVPGYKFMARGKDFTLLGESAPRITGKTYSRLEATLRQGERAPTYQTDLLTKMISGGRETKVPAPRLDIGTLEFWRPEMIRVSKTWPKRPYKAPPKKLSQVEYIREDWANLAYRSDYTARITGKKIPTIKETGRVTVKEKLLAPKQMPKEEQLFLIDRGIRSESFDYFLGTKAKGPAKPLKQLWEPLPKEFVKPQRGTVAFEFYALGKYADYLKRLDAGKIPRKQRGPVPSQIQTMKPTRTQMAEWHESFLKDYFGEVSAGTSAVQALSKSLTGGIQVPQPKTGPRIMLGGLMGGDRGGARTTPIDLIQIPKPRGREAIITDMTQFVSEGLGAKAKPKTIGGPRMREFIGTSQFPELVPGQVPEIIPKITPRMTVKLKPKQWLGRTTKTKPPATPRAPPFVFTPFAPAIRAPPFAIRLPTPFGGGVRKKVGRPVKTTRAGRKYKPSLLALMFGITAKKQPVTTGIGIRPIISTELPSLHDLFAQRQVRKYVKKTKKRK